LKTRSIFGVTNSTITTQSVYSKGGFNYDHLIEQFGATKLQPDLIQKIQKILEDKGKKISVHPFLKRGLFVSHRDLDVLVNEYEGGKPFYLYTGRGPSGGMHLGHLVPFMFTRFLQQAFDVPVVIQLTDDEKFLHRDLDLDEIRVLLRENCKDIIACGFDVEKTFIFSNFDYMGILYPNVVKIQKLITNNQVRGIFGVTPSSNIGQTSFPAIQAAPSFFSSFPEVLSLAPGPARCLIPCGLDQDPYFRMTRDIVPRLSSHNKKEVFLKPAILHGTFLPSLESIEEKMSASKPDSAIFLTDTPDQVKKKVSRAASGGRADKKEHMRLGADLVVDVPFHFCKYFLEDDQELEQIRHEYGTGAMMSSQIKQRTCKLIDALLAEHQARRALVTEELVDQFLKARPLSFSPSK
jgi:tryptophanyl-tRNA synthetase